MQRDGQVFFVDLPQFLKRAFCLAARVYEDERGDGTFDRFHHLRHRMMRKMTCPRDIGIRREDIDLRLRAALPQDQRGTGFCFALGDEEALQRARILDGGGEADAAVLRSERGKPRKRQRQEIAAFGIVERVQLIEHDGAKFAEEFGSIFRGEQERELLGRCQQDVGRDVFLALAARSGRVAGAGFDADIEAHFGCGRFEISRDVHRQGFQRRDIERVNGAGAASGMHGTEFDQAGQETRQCLAAAGGGDQENAFATSRMLDQGKLVRARRPAFRREPFGEDRRQGVDDLGRDIHGRHDSRTRTKRKPLSPVGRACPNR